jgi:hypothetical protein
MKNLFLSLAILFSVTPLFSQQTTRLQVIHNAADPSAAVVDVYVNGGLAIDNFEFRAATPFIDVPANTLLNIGIAPGNSGSVNDTIKNFQATLNKNKRYVLIANGVLDPSLFSPNPDGKDISFTLFAKDNIREQGVSWNKVDFVVVHGSTDAPTIDVIAERVYSNDAIDISQEAEKELVEEGEGDSWFSGGLRIVNNASYGDITNYKRLFPKEYLLKVTPGNNNNIVVAEFEANLSGLGGGATVVFASGFLDPSINQNGAAFGIFAALPNGTVVEFPMVQPMARLQVIHNAADPIASSVDVYLNGTLALDNFGFRTATPFIDIPAGVVINIGVAPGNSGSVNDTIKNFPVTFENGKTYVGVANGVINPAQFSANPDGRNIAFTIFAKDGIRESGMYSGKVDFVVLHGSTDAPTVDVIARNVATIVDNAAYGDFTDYIRVPAASYILDITPGDDNNTIVASFQADLSGLGGGAAVVFASGFLNPAGNQNGAPFGLFAALPNGTVVEFPAVAPFARLQVIHNAADPIASSVDVYLNGTLALDDFAFRTATPYIDVPAGVDINIGVAPGNSGSVNDTIKNFVVNFASGGTYVAIANGVVDPTGFAQNPNGRDISFTLFAKTDARETANNNNKVDLFAVHGSTDAPTVNIFGLGIYLNNVSYGDLSNYVSVPAWKNWLVITTPWPNFSVVGVWSADLRGLGGNSAVVFASGFLDPSANQNGESFGLFAALANGTVVELPQLYGDQAQNALEKVMDENNEQVAIVSDINLEQNYPNPFNPSTSIKFTVPASEFVTLKVYDVLGNEVATLVNEQKAPGTYEVRFDAGDLASGVYVYKMQAGNFTQTRKLMLMK